MATAPASAPLTQKLFIPVSAAPWKPSLVENIQRDHQINPTKPEEFYLATVDSSGHPRVRTLYHHGFWGEVASMNSSSTDNPPTFESDCPTFITGAKSNKSSDIYSAGLDHCRSETGSGGGADVELVYRFQQHGLQWRIRGKCWLMSLEGDSKSPHDQLQIDQGVQLARQAVGAYVRPTNASQDAVHMVRQKGGDAETNVDGYDAVRRCWDTQIENHVTILDVEQREAFEKVGLRVGIVLPEAVEMRDLMNNTKQLWALQEREASEAVGWRIWTAVKAWP